MAGHHANNVRVARIERIEVHRLSVPLVRPYALAFGNLTAFDTLLVELTDSEGKKRLWRSHAPERLHRRKYRERLGARATSGKPRGTRRP